MFWLDEDFWFDAQAASAGYGQCQLGIPTYRSGLQYYPAEVVCMTDWG